MRGKESKLHLGWHRSWQRDSFARAGYDMAIRPRRKYVHAALDSAGNHVGCVVTRGYSIHFDFIAGEISLLRH